MAKRRADVNKSRCVACGECAYVCPRGAIGIVGGRYANVNGDICVGCGLCVKNCPAGCIDIMEGDRN